MKKRSVQIIISLIIISLLLSPVFAYGLVREGEGEAVLLQEGEYDIPQAVKKRSPLLKATANAEEYIYNELSDMSSSINLSSYGISVNDISALYSHVINSHPDLFFVSGAFGYNYYPANNTVAYLSPNYTMSTEEVSAAMTVFNAGAQKALAEVDDSMSDMQKVLTLHDYICSVAIYPYLEQDSQGNVLNDEHDWHTAYGFFRDNIAVCAGYSLAYEYLLNQLGIECVYVGSDPMAHAWNKVKLDGSWYNVDITFDDLDISRDVNTYNSVRHAHFLKSDDYFYSESGSYHFGGTTYNDCTADSTTYDSAFWDRVTSRIYVVGGNFYYLDPGSANTYNVYFRKRTVSGTTSLMCSYFSTATQQYNSRPYDENGVVHETSFTDYLARLAYLDNRFYIISGKTVYSVLLGGTKYTITSTDNYSNGLGVNENGNLFWQPYNDSTVLNELDKLEYYNNYLTTSRGSNYNNYPDINLDGVINVKDYVYITK